MQGALDKRGLPARDYYRVLKVALTLSDLSQSEEVERRHLMASLDYRKIEQKLAKAVGQS